MAKEIAKQMGKKGTLQHIRIEPAKNGYTVHAHHSMPMGDGKNPESLGAASDSQPAVFTKKKHVLDHVKGLLNEHEGMDPGADNDANDSDDMPVKTPANHPVRRLSHKMY